MRVLCGYILFKNAGIMRVLKAKNAGTGWTAILANPQKNRVTDMGGVLGLPSPHVWDSVFWGVPRIAVHPVYYWENAGIMRVFLCIQNCSLFTPFVSKLYFVQSINKYFFSFFLPIYFIISRWCLNVNSSFWNLSAVCRSRFTRLRAWVRCLGFI